MMQFHAQSLDRFQQSKFYSQIYNTAYKEDRAIVLGEGRLVALRLIAITLNWPLSLNFRQPSAGEEEPEGFEKPNQ